MIGGASVLKDGLLQFSMSFMKHLVCFFNCFGIPSNLCVFLSAGLMKSHGHNFPNPFDIAVELFYIEHFVGKSYHMFRICLNYFSEVLNKSIKQLHISNAQNF